MIDLCLIAFWQEGAVDSMGRPPFLSGPFSTDCNLSDERLLRFGRQNDGQKVHSLLEETPKQGC